MAHRKKKNSDESHLVTFFFFSILQQEREDELNVILFMTKTKQYHLTKVLFSQN